MSDLLHPIVICVALLQAMLCLGATMILISHYWLDHRKGHIVRIAIGHVLLTLLVSHSLVVGLYRDFWWRLPMAMIAFYFTDSSLLKLAAIERLIRDQKKQKFND